MRAQEYFGGGGALPILESDLRGLPPSQTEIDTFLRDPSPDDIAFAKVVDAFLQSERFGERWAWEWLDLAQLSS